MKDMLRNLLSIRQQRRPAPVGSLPQVGATIQRGEVKMAIDRPVSRELWDWLVLSGWRSLPDLNPQALQTPVLTQIFERMRQLAGYLDPGFLQRRWDQATDMVAGGQALLQVQGSWVDGEFTAKGMEPGREYQCWRFPDTQGVYLFNSDQFVFFKQPPGRQAAQRAFASALMAPALQVAVNVRTGAAPARVDVPQATFNRCGQRNITDMRRANMRRAMMGSIAMGNAHPSAVKTAIYDVVTRHLQGRLDTAGAVAALRLAVATSTGDDKP